MDGEEGFIQSPEVRSLTLNTKIDDQDPVAQSFIAGADVGVIGIEMATRRRNRFSGACEKERHRLFNRYFVRPLVTAPNTFMNVNGRGWPANKPGKAIERSDLSQSQIALIQKSDTMVYRVRSPEGGRCAFPWL